MFYVTAHQDDALLFRGEQLYADLLRNPAVRVIHIFTTAGDRGRTDGWWQAREQGAVAALTASLAAAACNLPVNFWPGNPFGFGAHCVTVNNHLIHGYIFGNSISYFLRLPDGGVNNSGFASTGYQTLSKLRDGMIATIHAVDGSATYTSWSDFCATLRLLMAQEANVSQNPHPWVSASDYDQALDPHGHPDHYATGDALRTFVAGTYNRLWWVSYDTANRPPNLAGPALANKRCLFCTYSFATQIRMSLSNIFAPPKDGEWRAWGNKSYARLVSYDQPDE